MLIAKGYAVGFKLDGLRNLVRAPRTYAMLHDPSGEDFPKDMVLVDSFDRGAGTVREPDATSYFGYQPRRGTIHLPSRDLKNWTRLGSVDAIDYTRPGEHRGDYRHEFASGWIFPGVKPILYKQKRMLLLHFQNGSIINWRGFVWP
jgi:hypothetical protein